MLGDQAVLHGNASRIRLCKKPFKFSSIRNYLFVENISQVVPFGGNSDKDSLV